MERETVHNLIILDESGSMHSAREITIDAFNALLEQLKTNCLEFPEQEHKITMLTFSTAGFKKLMDNEPINAVRPISLADYIPNGGTPLYDAMGFSVSDIRAYYEKKNIKPKVLVSIFTDGLENASREYSGRAIKSLVEELEGKGWTFTYIGADHDVLDASANIGINNNLSFDKSESGVKQMMELVSDGTRHYYTKIREKKNIGKDDFFANTTDKK